ncbi:MAG: gliding motility-associated C-terminal domain-containing protein [Bacteroidia bacterium]
MKYIKLLCLIIFSLLATSDSTACDVINGSDIKFIHMGGYKYHVKYILYHQCVCQLGVMPTFTISCGANSLKITPPRTSIRDITPVCSSGQPPCKNGGGGGTRYGIEEHIFEDTIDFEVAPYKQFLNNNCCEVMFRVAQPWGLIGTTTSTTTYGGEAMMNLCNIGKKGNTTPTLSTIPMSFMCCNQPFTFNNGVFDNTDYDSLSFALDEPLSSGFIPVSWNSPLNKDIPLTPFCPPNPGKVNCRALPNAKPPRGFYFDEETGDMVLTPTKCDESGPVAIKVTEWRRDSATKKMLKIGFVRRDIYVTVVTCPDNNPPYIEGVNKHNVCEGNKICFTIDGKDDAYLPKQTTPDTVHMTWNQGIPGATFRIIDPTLREKEAEFCWTPKVGDARNAPYTFAVTAKDDACPRPAYTIKGFIIKVNPKARDTRKYDYLGCGRLKFTAIPEDTVNYNASGYRYKFIIRDSTNSGIPYYLGYSAQDSVKFQHGGKYIIEHEINNPPYNCPTIYSDTIIIPPVLDIGLAFGKDTFVCDGNDLTLTPEISNGVPSYKYRWEAPIGSHNPKDTLAKFTLVKPKQDVKVVLTITDNKTCVDHDTILVRHILNPIVDIGPDQRICTYNSVILDAGNNDTIMRYYWTPYGDSTRTIEVNVAGKYSVKVIDTLGCNTSDTMELFVNDTVVAIAKPHREICIYDTLKVTGKRRPLGYVRSIKWRDIGSGLTVATDSAFELKISTMAERNYEMHLQVNQMGVVCENKDTFTLTVNALPTFLFKGLPPRCYADGAINLTQNAIATASSGDNSVKESDLRYYQNKTPSWITGGPVGVNTFVYDFPKFISNAQVPKAGLRDTICYEYRDYKGCYNKECKATKLNPNPDVLLKEGTFCQKAGKITLDNLVVRPFSKVGGIQSFRCLDVPQGSGVNPVLIVAPNYSTLPPTTELDPGQEGENQKTGTYVVEYCFQDALTGCKTCDTTNVYVVKLPEIQFTGFPSLCVNDPLLALDSFVQDRNTGRRFPDGVWGTVEYNGSRDKSNPNISPKLLNSVINQKTFDPQYGAGQYLVKLTDSSSGCPVSDSTDIVVYGLPIIQIDVPDTVCSSSAPFALNNKQPTGPVGTWTGPGVVGRDFDPAVSTKSQQYEGPMMLKFEYTNPLTGCVASDSQSLLVQSQPEVDITTPKPYQQCEGIVFDLESTKAWAAATQWSTSGDGSFGTADQLTTTYTHGLNDTALAGLNGKVLLTISTVKEGVCPVATDDIDLIIEPYPQFNFVGDPLIQCEPAMVNFLATVVKPAGSPNLRYNWEYGNGDSLYQSTMFNPQNVTYDTANRNWYNVALTVNNQWGADPSEVCAIRLEKSQYVKVLPQPRAGFDSDPGFFTTVAFPKFKFFNKTEIRWETPGEVTYEWNFGTNDPNDTLNNEINPIHTYPDDTTTYWVNLNAIYSYSELVNGNKQIYQCSDSIGELRKIGPDVTVFVPTAFSPEGTGPRTNNVFLPIVNGEKTYHIDLFNRWGELLWTSEDKFESWDGKYEGEDVQQDVYIWVIKVTAYDGEEYQYEGTVTLLR